MKTCRANTINGIKCKRHCKDKYCYQHKKGGGKWSKKYKKSINCKKPKGFSQKQFCKYNKENFNN